MKAITLTQPWSTLVAIGAKHIETRSWKTSYRGPLAIHSGKDFPVWARKLCYKEPFLEALKPVLCPNSNVMFLDQLLAMPRGAVVAVCELSDCVQILEGGSILTEHPEVDFGDYTYGRFAWFLEGARPLPEPIPAKGAQGLWNWTPPKGFVI